MLQHSTNNTGRLMGVNIGPQSKSTYCYRFTFSMGENLKQILKSGCMQKPRVFHDLWTPFCSNHFCWFFKRNVYATFPISPHLKASACRNYKKLQKQHTLWENETRVPMAEKIRKFSAASRMLFMGGKPDFKRNGTKTNAFWSNLCWWQYTYEGLLCKNHY